MPPAHVFPGELTPCVLLPMSQHPRSCRIRRWTHRRMHLGVIFPLTPPQMRRPGALAHHPAASCVYRALGCQNAGAFQRRSSISPAAADLLGGLRPACAYVLVLQSSSAVHATGLPGGHGSLFDRSRLEKRSRPDREGRGGGVQWKETGSVGSLLVLAMTPPPSPPARPLSPCVCVSRPFPLSLFRKCVLGTITDWLVPFPSLRPRLTVH